jgi:hypothetical protein
MAQTFEIYGHQVTVYATGVVVYEYEQNCRIRLRWFPFSQPLDVECTTKRLALNGVALTCQAWFDEPAPEDLDGTLALCQLAIRDALAAYATPPDLKRLVAEAVDDALVRVSLMPVAGAEFRDALKRNKTL